MASGTPAAGSAAVRP